MNPRRTARPRARRVAATASRIALKPYRLLVADDHPIVRAGLSAVLNQLAGVEVVGEAATGLEVLAAIGTLAPDLVLLDIAMPELNGLDTAARITRLHPSVKVMILSMHEHEEYVIRALRAGVAGYLVKGSATHELEHAIGAIRRGETYLSPGIARRVLEAYAARVFGGANAEPLTSRQREVLTRIADGQSTKEIAFGLGVSIKTIESHRAEIGRRLGISEVAGLVKYAMRTGLVKPAL